MFDTGVVLVFFCWFVPVDKTPECVGFYSLAYGVFVCTIACMDFAEEKFLAFAVFRVCIYDFPRTLMLLRKFYRSPEGFSCEK